MNSIRIRVVKSAGEIPFHIQVSIDGILWWTLASFKEFDPALGDAKLLAETLKNNWKVEKPTHILWKTVV